MKTLLSILTAIFSVNSSAETVSQQKDPVDLAIEAASNKPIDETIMKIARIISTQEIIIPSQNTDAKGSSIQLLTGQDKNGNHWVYIYSDKAHLSSVFPSGTPIFVMSFHDFKKIIEANPNFRGIYINSSYPVPRELFGKFFSIAE